MQAGIARSNGRTFLAALTAAVLVMSMVVLFANPAEADHDPHDDTVANNGPAGTNDAPYWVNYLETVRGISGASCAKINQSSGSAFVMPSEPDGEDWVLLVVKQETTNYVFYDPIAGHSYPSGGPNAPGYSHVIVCSVEEPEETTTTTAPTTTTTAPTTTTTAPTTTTTVPEETTTTVPEETTTTIPDEVMALVFVTVKGECVVDDGKGEGKITVGVSVDDAATVVIRNSNGRVVASVNSDAVITVPEGATYAWEATPSEGFEFASDFVAGGEVKIESCTPKDEVKGIEVLPFTGIETEALAILASVLSAIGLLVILATRRVEN
jgi:hypothetical protein